MVLLQLFLSQDRLIFSLMCNQLQILLMFRIRLRRYGQLCRPDLMQAVIKWCCQLLDSKICEHKMSSMECRIGRKFNTIDDFTCISYISIVELYLKALSLISLLCTSNLMMILRILQFCHPSCGLRVSRLSSQQTFQEPPVKKNGQSLITPLN